jgi:hypothetical protein
MRLPDTWVNKGIKKGRVPLAPALGSRPSSWLSTSKRLKEADFVPLRARYRPPPASDVSSRIRLAASSEAPMASSLSQNVIPSILLLWRSPRALSPLNPSSCLALGRTCSLAWRRPSSSSSVEPSKILTLACRALHLLSYPASPSRVTLSSTSMMLSAPEPAAT